MTVRQPRGVLVALPLVLTLTGCSTGQPQKQYLDALESDPVATWMPEQGRLAFEGTDEARLGSTTHKQQPARIIRRIELPDEQSRAQAWRDGVSFARGHGWTLQSRTRSGAQLSRPGPDGHPAALFVGPASDDAAGVTVELQIAP